MRLEDKQISGGEKKRQLLSILVAKQKKGPVETHLRKGRRLKNIKRTDHLGNSRVNDAPQLLELWK